jgi:hypothetical protein
MAGVYKRHHLIGREMFLTRKQGMRNLDPLMGRIDCVATQ